jgi:hypothetical protein
MRMFYYSSRDNPHTKRLKAVIRAVIPHDRIESFACLPDFEKRLRIPVEPDSIAVLSIDSRKELVQMQKLREMLTEIYILMIIPDREKRTFELAHILLPRFLSQKESDFVNLRFVLNKMFIHSQLAPLVG